MKTLRNLLKTETALTTADRSFLAHAPASTLSPHLFRLALPSHPLVTALIAWVGILCSKGRITYH